MQHAGDWFHFENAWPREEKHLTHMPAFQYKTCTVFLPALSQMLLEYHRSNTGLNNKDCKEAWNCSLYSRRARNICVFEGSEMTEMTYIYAILICKVTKHLKINVVIFPPNVSWVQTVRDTPNKCEFWKKRGLLKSEFEKKVRIFKERSQKCEKGRVLKKSSILTKIRI